jgi:serine/threonine protein kinase/DNA-binding winged helix-turn-helix (wHTH) protein/tetratricopeptide (TPR) repeat protein
MKDTLPPRVRIGIFELDLKSGELHWEEEKILLQEQPFQALLMLVERDGEIVTREEIKNKLWPNDTIVEFDHSINAAIKNLRRALGDSATEPKVIETVARRGYRLVVPVEWIEAPVEASRGEVFGGDGITVRRQLASGVLTGRIVSHYRVLDIIGGGGMGVVYRAEDLKLGRRVALKFLPEELGTEPLALERFNREARAASSLDHPNICHIYEFGEHEGYPFMAMQLLEGQTLRDRLAKVAEGDALSLGELLAIAIQVSDGLQAAHEKGIIHRDIKPANIFLTSKGVCKILDFGLVKMLEGGEENDVAAQPECITVTLPSASGATHLTRTGTAMGTAGYMSPEQVRGENLDARSDLFSFGLILYEMAAGRRAFSGDTAAIVHDAILNHRPIPVHEINSIVPRTLEYIIQRALEKDRDLRYQRASDLRADLQRLKIETESERGVPATSETLALAPRASAGQKKKFLKIAIPAVILLVASLIVGELYSRSHHPRPMTENDTIVLADFTNTTGDPVFDDTLKTGLSVALNQSPFLNVLSETKVGATLKLMTRPANSAVTPELARELCLRAGSTAYIAGSIASLDSKYVVGLRAVNCKNAALLAEEQATAPAKEKVVGALGEAVAKLRGALGESLVTVQKLNLPLEEATTSSLEALKAYSLGEKTMREVGTEAALPYHQRAVELDPNFALGYQAVGSDYHDLLQDERAREYYTRAFQLCQDASDRERLLIVGDYYLNVVGDYDKGAHTYQELIATYPRETRGYNGLGNIYEYQGQYEKAEVLYRQTVRLAPDIVETYENLVSSLIPLQRFDDTRQVIHEARARKLDHLFLHVAEFGIAFVTADSQGMAEQQQWLAAQPKSEHYGLGIASDTEAYVGHLDKALNLTRQAVDSARQNDAKENGAMWQENAALREAAFGHTAEARKRALAGLKLAPSSEGVETTAALALAMIGDASVAAPLIRDLDMRFPQDTQMQLYWLPAIRSQLAIKRNNPTAAIDLLRVTAPVEFGGISFTCCNITCLHATYTRGQAYLAAGQGAAAAYEFQKIVDHPEMVWNCWTGALAHLGVARANALLAKDSQGVDADAARFRSLAAYNDFLAIWKDADPSIPVYRQAKEEYRKLQ